MFNRILICYFFLGLILGDLTIRNYERNYKIDLNPTLDPKQFFFKKLSPVVRLCLKAQEELKKRAEYDPVSTTLWRLIWKVPDRQTRMSSYRSDGYEFLMNLTKEADDIINDKTPNAKLSGPMKPMSYEEFKLFQKDGQFTFNFNNMQQLISETVIQKMAYLDMYNKDVQVDNKFSQGKLDQEEIWLDFLNNGSNKLMGQFIELENKLITNLKIIDKLIKSDSFRKDMETMTSRYRLINELYHKIDFFFLDDQISHDVQHFIRLDFTRRDYYEGILKDIKDRYERKSALEEMQSRQNAIIRLLLHTKDKKQKDETESSTTNLTQSQSTEPSNTNVLGVDENIDTTLTESQDLNDESATTSSISSDIPENFSDSVDSSENSSPKNDDIPEKSNQLPNHQPIDERSIEMPIEPKQSFLNTLNVGLYSASLSLGLKDEFYNHISYENLPSSLENFEKDLKIIENAITKEDTAMAAAIKILKDKFKQRLTKINKEIQKLDGYKQYKIAIKKVVSKVKKLERQVGYCQTFNSMIHDSEMKIGKFKMNKEIAQSFQKRKKIIGESNNPWATATAFVIPKDQEEILISKIEEIAQVNDPIVNIKLSGINKDLKKVLHFYRPEIFPDIQGYQKKMITRNLKQLHLVQNIRKLESKIDREMAKLFAFINTKMGMFKCFTRKDLVFLIFKMVKTNMIIDEKSFMNSFLKSMPVKDQSEFIFYFYSIMTNSAFMKDLQMRYDYKDTPTTKKLFYRNLRLKFTNNFVIIANLYKDLTRYRTDSAEANETKVTRRRRFYNSVLSQIPWKTLLKKGIESGLTATIKYLLDLIPFLGNIPFLNSILAKFFSYLLIHLFKFIIEKLSNNTTIFKKMRRFRRGVVKFFSKTSIVSLDYRQYIEDQMQEEDEQFKVNTTPEKIESKLYQGFDKKDPSKYEDMFFSMKKYFYMITIEDKSKNYEAIERFIEYAHLNPDGFFPQAFYRDKKLGIDEVIPQPQTKEEIIQRIYGLSLIHI